MSREAPYGASKKLRSNEDHWPGLPPTPRLGEVRNIHLMEGKRPIAGPR